VEESERFEEAGMKLAEPVVEFFRLAALLPPPP
jgi:hypothetical protein